MSISKISLLEPNRLEQESKEKIQLQMLSEPCMPEVIVKRLISIEGPVDVYFWYEGQYLPKSGALFMKQQICELLYKLKQDIKLYAYSLKAWDFKGTVATLPSSTPLGEAINRINTSILECIYSASFFQYCAQASKEGGLYALKNK